MFVVTVLFGKDDQMASTALITNELDKAVHTAQSIEKHGYEFGPNGFAIIHRLVENHVYTQDDFIKAVFSGSGEVSKDDSLIFARWIRLDGQWKEKWHQERYRKKFMGDAEPAVA